MTRAYVAISITTLFWAGNFTVGKLATEEINPFFLAPLRVLLSAGLFLMLLPREERRITKADMRAVFPLALSGIAINHLCFAAGIERTTPSHSAILHALIPAFVAVMAWFTVKEKLRGLGILGMVLAVAGALIVVLPRSGGSPARGDLVGDVITFGGVLAFSFYTAYGRRVLGSRGGLRTLALAFLFAAPLVLPVLVYGTIIQDWSKITWKGWTALAYMWICANLIAYQFHFYALSRLSAGRVAAFIDIQPAIGIAIAVWAGKDVLTAELVIGAAIALAGVVLVQLRRGS